MWLLPTRGRPESCVELIAAMGACGDIPQRVAVMVDDDPRNYAGVPWPQAWTIHRSDEHLEMTRAVNTLLTLHPGESCYGFFGDHFRPQVPMFEALQEAAGDWLIAWPCDGEGSYRQPSGAITFGGKLVKALGWICLPTTVHVCTDRVWWHLWRRLGIVRHLEQAKFTRTWPLGPGPVQRCYRGHDYNAHDYAAWLCWRDNHAPRLIQDIRRAMTADGYRFGADGRIASEHGCTPFHAGW